MDQADADSSDFTFCQVSPPVDQYQVDSPKTLPSFQNMMLEEPSARARPPKHLDSSTLTNSQSTPTDNSTPLSNLETRSTSSNGESASDALTQKKPVQKKAARAKVPFEKGYSQMDWLKLTRTDPDLAGLKGKSNQRLITLEEVKQHKSTEGHIWTVLKGRVYNISPYLKFHPGGADMLMKAAGKDCTSLFNKYHAWVNAEFLMEKCLVGFLDVNE